MTTVDFQMISLDVLWNFVNPSYFMVNEGMYHAQCTKQPRHMQRQRGGRTSDWSKELHGLHAAKMVILIAMRKNEDRNGSCEIKCEYIKQTLLAFRYQTWKHTSFWESCLSQTVPLFLLSLIHEMSMRCQPTSVSYLWVYRQTPQKLSLIICGYQVDAL